MIKTMTVNLSAPPWGGYVVTRDGPAPGVAVYQIDYSYPSLAEDLGASIICEHGRTDGTVDCPDCGKTASQFIEAAANWLWEHAGDSFEINEFTSLYEILSDTND